MGHILGISGSLREASYNSALLRAAKSIFPDQLTIARIDRIPLYNADIESAGFPQEVADLKQQVAEAEGLLLVSPEYNNSLPGVLKNAIDWLSRPSGDIRNVFQGKPVAVTGASPGGFGTALAQSAWLPVLRTLRASYWAGGRLMVSHVSDAFDDTGNLVDERLRERLASYVGDFIAYCEDRG
jgi:NAD(P)H-dependent FMN reductase